jgi:cytochrome P450
MLMAIIEGRLAEKDTNGYGNDLLGLMLEARALEQEGHQMLTTQEIVDECKTFFFAGQDTTSHLLTWTMFLLSRYPEWQHRLREEVLRECGNAVPKPDMVTKLKLVNWPRISLAIFFFILLRLSLQLKVVSPTVQTTSQYIDIPSRCCSG